MTDFDVTQSITPVSESVLYNSSKFNKKPPTEDMEHYDVGAVFSIKC